MPTGIDTTGAWPAEQGLESINGFMKSRRLVLRAMKNCFASFAVNYLNGINSLLEIGSGIGFLEQNWPTYSWTWTQLEQTPEFIEEARKRSPGCTYVNSSVYELPFPDNSFDAVCGFSSFDCLFDLEGAVKETIRVLKPNGIFFHMLDLCTNDETLLEDFLSRKIPASIQGRNSMPSPFSRGKNTHLRYVPEDKLDAFLAELGITKAEMHAMPDLQDGLCDAYLRKMGKKGLESSPNPNCVPCDNLDQIEELMEMEEISNSMLYYFDLFEKYSVVLDENAYFSQRMVDTLTKYANPGTVDAFKITGTFKGKREPWHKEAHESGFYFKMDGGQSIIGAPMFSPSYWAYSAAKGRFPRLANACEPKCYETSVIDCVVARKAA
jgi:ubiquinone/menaquinone biosynthesis C-methylase UbiE